MLYILIFFVVLFQQVAQVRDRVPALVQCLWHSYLLVPSLVLRNKRNSFLCYHRYNKITKNTNCIQSYQCWS